MPGSIIDVLKVVNQLELTMKLQNIHMNIANLKLSQSCCYNSFKRRFDEMNEISSFCILSTSSLNKRSVWKRNCTGK